MTDYTEYRKALSFLTTFFNGASLYSKNKRNEPHIRIYSNEYIANSDSIESFISKYKEFCVESFDSRFSSSYKTFLFNLPEVCNIPIPLVLCTSDYKKNNKDSVIQKQLTPFNLGVVGEYKDLDYFLKKVKDGLFKVSPSLSSYWQSNDKEEFITLLLKLVNQSIENPVSFTDREINIIKQSSIGKDFGEILVAANLLKKYGNIFITNVSNTSNYDLTYTDFSGLISKVNVKSGVGSGQSFTSVSKYLSVIDKENYVEGSKAEILIRILRTINFKQRGSGKTTVFEIMELGCLFNDDLGKFLKEVKKEFFNNKSISEENYIKKETFDDFSRLATAILERCNLKIAGIPIGNNQKTTSYTYEKEDGPLNAILFYLLTNFSKNFDQQVFSNVMKKAIKSDIEVINVSFDDNGLVLNSSENTNYTFHYWSNFSNPLNNFIGFKINYSL